MRILIDTNIFIYRENDHVVPESLQKLLKILNGLRAEILFHPKSVEELQKDLKEDRKKVVLSKINVYISLEHPPDPTKDDNFLSIVGHPSKSNDYVDNAVLYAVHRDAVDFLITADKGIRKKADKLNIKDRVLSIEEALGIFEKNFGDAKVRRPPALKEEFVYNLDINDPFFDTLKEEYTESEEYEGFEDWFRKISRKGRKCWVHLRENGAIGALLIYKDENESIGSDPPLPAKKRLKISTFKATYLGRKIGELFIKLSVEYSIKKNFTEIYLTHFTEQEDRLVDLITEYGFYKVARNRRGEDVYIKELFPAKEKLKSLSPLEISKRSWPSYYDGAEVNKFIIPIRPEYHERLFTEYGGRQTKLNEHLGEFIIEGNTIKKAYLCHSKITKIHPGDILLFYRSRDRHELTSLGVVEEIFTKQKDKDKIMRLVGKRTVYSMAEIGEMAEKPTMVILFTWHFHLSNPLNLGKLKKIGVLTGAPQSIGQISHMRYRRIKREGGVDGRFAVN